MGTAADIPIIDIAPLFGPWSEARAVVDRAIIAAATSSGVMTITGLPQAIPSDDRARRQLLRLFEAPRALRERLACNRHDPARPLLRHG